MAMNKIRFNDENDDTCKFLPINPDIGRMIETILAQNAEIVKINGQLIASLASTMQLVTCHKTLAAAEFDKTQEEALWPKN